MAYRGRVDDRYVDFGVDRPAPTTRDLDQALTNLLAGTPVEPKTTRARWAASCRTCSSEQHEGHERVSIAALLKDDGPS